MMKRITILLLLSFSATIYAQQSEIKGIISIHNSEYETGKRQYVPNAQIEDDFAKATPQTTDANGNFKLVFVRIPEKTSVQLIVKKEDLQVVNIDGLNAVTGQRDLVRLSMARPDKIAEYRRQIYQVGKTEAEKNLAAQLKKKGAQIEILQKDIVKNKTAIEKLQKEYAELQAFASKIEGQAQDLARRYAPINLDDAAPLYRESFRLFQQGELDRALQILRGGDVEKLAIKVIKKEKFLTEELQKLQAGKPDLMQLLGLKADLHKSKFQWDSVLFCLELRVNLDSTNVDNIRDLAGFLAEQNKKHEATAYFEKALTLAKIPELKATLLNSLGRLYLDNLKMLQAEVTFNESLKIRRELAEKNPDAFLPDLAFTLNSLGAYYYLNKKMPQSEGAYDEALKIIRKLVENNQDVFLPDLATTLNNLGEFYRGNQKMPQADEAFNEALKIRKQLAKKNPDAFLPDLAGTLNNLGIYYRGNQEMLQAEAAFNEALKIYRQLTEKNPDAFLPYVATNLNNLGGYYLANLKMQQAKVVFKEALKIYRQLAQKNPDAFLPYVAAILNNVIILNIEKPKEAEKYLKECLLIRRKLAQVNPDGQNLELARTLMIGGAVYDSLENSAQSQAYLKEALSIAEQYPEVPFAQQVIRDAKEKIKK